MKRILSLIFSLGLAVSAAYAQQLVAGAAKVDVTPSVSELVRDTDIIRGTLNVRALYLSDGITPAVIITVDGDLRQTEEPIRRIHAATGIPKENIIISGTHSHSPGTNGISPDSKPTYAQLFDAAEKAAVQAKAAARPARVGYGKRPLDLNVNRDNYNEHQEWSQTPNWTGASDKDLTVISFLDKEDVPIAVYMNYGMHPVNFFMSGVVSADFPGDACDLVEKVFGGKTVALFCQNASGDQNPKLAYSDIFREGQVKGVKADRHATRGSLDLNTPTVAADQVAAHKAVIDRKDEYVRMLGNAVGFKALEIMLYDMQYEENPVVRAAEEIITFPGRERIDKEGRENYDPGYKDGPDVHLGMGVLRIGDIHIVTVSAEIYSEIALHIKKASPAAKTMVVTIADGPFESGYIYSDNAANHLTFQVIGSRIKPGYAEKGIVESALRLIQKVR